MYVAYTVFPLDSIPLKLGEHRSLDLDANLHRVGSIGWVREKPEARTRVRRLQQQASPPWGLRVLTTSHKNNSYHHTGCHSCASLPLPAPFLIFPAWKLARSSCATSCATPV